MKKITIFTAIIIVLVLTFPCFSSADLPRVVDDADILSYYEEELLLELLDEISERQQFDIAVCTIDSLEGYSAMDYADNFYENHGYGFGADYDGTLLLIAMDEREWWITTEGYGITVLSDYKLMQIENVIVSYLSEGDYYSAFEKYASMCDSFVTEAREGYSDSYDDKYDDPYYNDSYYDDDYVYYPDIYYPDDYYDPGYSKSSPGFVFVSIVIGFIIGLICVSVMKGQLKSVRKAIGAASYEVSGSLKVTRSQDLFLYRTVRKIRIDDDSPHSSHGGHRSGGMRSSSVHRSSSGRSHGGRGGRF